MKSRNPETKRILVIAPLSPPITGQQKASNELVRTLRARYLVDTIDYSKSDFRAGNFSIGRTIAVLGMVLTAWKRSRRTDAIYLTVSQSLLGNLRDLLIIAGCRRQATVLHLHGSGIGSLIFEKRPLLRFINRLAYREVSAAIVLSKSLRFNYSPVFPVDRIAIVSGFVDAPAIPEATLVAKHNAEFVRILYLSNMIVEKGFRDLLEGYCLLDAKTRARVDLTFVGKFDGEHAEAAFRSEIGELETVSYLGVVSEEEKRELLGRSSLLCLPTYYPYEGQPVVILEAYSYGCIVLTTGQGGIPDIFEDGINGFHVEARCPMSIANGIRRVVEMSPHDRKTIAAENLHRARERFSRKVFERNILGVFERAVGEITAERPVDSRSG